MNDNIWLVVWDIDRTFFQYEPDSNDSIPLEKYAEMIKKLISRGIMNACCSRSPLQVTRRKLDELGIWNCIIFPCINTNAVSKVERVEQIIKNTRLRPQYVLYLDNNVFNRRLAEATVPKINTAKPSEIFTLIEQPEMKGFTDKLHVRLAQYKLAKPLAEDKGFSSYNVMIHAAMECSLVDSGPHIPVIQKLFIESKALNFTGSQLSPDELSALLKEPDVKHGCVTMKDIIKDHGVVGFYAVRANKLLHFVFSAELLDIPGVEQWVYTRLGYPSITKSKYCIGEVGNTGAPDWINQPSPGLGVPDAVKGGTPRLLLRGCAELLGISRYLKKHASVTLELFDEPTSICYVAKGRQYSDEEKTDVLQSVPTLAKTVFSTTMFSGEYDYVIVSVLPERSMIKYSNKTNPALHTYLPRESLDKLSTEFFDQNQSYVYSDDELDDSLQYICDNLPKQTSIIILTAPEVDFTRVSINDGSDPNRYAADHQRRLRYNAIAEEIVVRNTNAYLLDIRGFIKSEADLSSFNILHYSPQVDYELSRIITALSGIRLPEPNRQYTAAPTLDAVLSPDSDIKLPYRAFITNGLFITQVEQPERTGLTFSFSVMMGSQVIEQTGFSVDAIHEARITAFGVYWTRVGVKLNNSEYYFDTSFFVYDEKTIFNYIDKSAPNYSNIYRSHLLPLFDAANEKKRINNDFNAEILALLSSGRSIFDYFELHGIGEISILADAKTAPLIIDSALTAKTRIKHMLTIEKPFSATASLGVRQYRFRGFNAEILSEEDVVLVAYMPGKREIADITKAVPNKIKTVWLHNILHSLSTEHFFANNIKDSVKRAGGGPIIILRLPTLRGLKNISPNDKVLLSYNTAKLLTVTGNNISSLPGILRNEPFDKLAQTAILPPTWLDTDNVWRFSDCEGTYMNITNGLRHTVNQPDKYAGTVYIFGGSMAFGKMASDDETIASRLQTSINMPLRILNCANFDGRMQAGRMLSLIDSIRFHPNDVIVIAMEEDQTASTIVPFQFKYIDNSFIKVDALSVLNGVFGAYYLNNVYSPLGNSLVAELLRETIYGLIRLF